MHLTPQQNDRITALLRDYAGEFMRPQIYHGRVARCVTPDGKDHVLPLEHCLADQRPNVFTGTIVRLSAPGYLDSTDWELMDSPESLVTWLEDNSPETL